MSHTTTSAGRTAPAVPRPGRPRSAEAHRAILDAAAALFIEEGFDAMSVEGVATRAAVGKATIYRRWPSKEDLVIDAIAQVFAEAPRPETGSVRDDLVQLGDAGPRASKAGGGCYHCPRYGSPTSRRSGTRGGLHSRALADLFRPSPLAFTIQDQPHEGRA